MLRILRPGLVTGQQVAELGVSHKSLHHLLRGRACSAPGAGPRTAALAVLGWDGTGSVMPLGGTASLSL